MEKGKKKKESRENYLSDGRQSSATADQPSNQSSWGDDSEQATWFDKGAEQKRSSIKRSARSKQLESFAAGQLVCIEFLINPLAGAVEQSS